MKSHLKYFLFYILVVIFNSCASMGSPSGGETDNSPPYLLMDKVIPQQNININVNQQIKLVFNERIHPNSIKSSIRVEPSIEFEIKNNGKEIFILPRNSWPKQFKIVILRELSDYNNNLLKSPIELLYSTENSLNTQIINGELFNVDTTQIYQIAIIDKDFKIKSQTESDYKGNFKFSGVTPSKNDIILATEGEISNPFIISIIRDYRYGISNTIISENFNQIYISPPIYKSSINNIALINNYYGEISFSDGNMKYLIFNSKGIKEINNDKYLFIDYNFQDSLNINISLNNHIERYQVSKTMMLNQVSDSSPPLVDKLYYSGDSLYLKFSEPIKIDNIINPFSSLFGDSTLHEINYNIITPHLLFFKEADIDNIHIKCEHLLDLSDNPLCDSTKILDVEHNKVLVEQKYGEINGNIIYYGQNKLLVEAKHTLTKNITRVKVINNKFILDKLYPGDYTIWVYEDINSITDEYYSGMLDPLKKSALFSIYNKELTVRSNWSNTINIEIK